MGSLPSQRAQLDLHRNTTTQAKTMLNRPLLALAALVIVGCAAKQPQPVLPKPQINSIAIIAATEPAEYTLQNLSAVQFVVPIAATFNHLDSKEKARMFNAQLQPSQAKVAQTLTDAVADTLRQRGYRVEILSGIVRPADSPDTIDYDKVVSTSDAILHVSISEVGLISPRSSNNYLPRFNASGVLFVKGREDYLYDGVVQYGVDARKGEAWAIEADPSFAYPSFEAVAASLDEIRRRLSESAVLVAKRIAEQAHAAAK
jgi:hypothetical protein